MRIGHGYDVHRMVSGRKLILGGVEIPFDRGLLGYSDADVLTHAVMDALLGGAGLGDIGKHFPDSDPRYRGISSLVLLRHVVHTLQEEGWKVGNLDATLVAQEPKISSFIPEMVRNFAQCMGVREDQINVKATTEEGLGFTGTGAGMAAHCVVLLERIQGTSKNPAQRAPHSFCPQNAP